MQTQQMEANKPNHANVEPHSIVRPILQSGGSAQFDHPFLGGMRCLANASIEAMPPTTTKSVTENGCHSPILCVQAFHGNTQHV